MAVTLRIMNWNIQNFGPTKSGLKHGNFDVVRAIAKTVVDSGTDIFVMLELNTKDGAKAKDLAEIMLTALDKYTGGAEFKVCVLSPNTGLEFYAFFIRDTTKTAPLPIVGSAITPVPPEVLGESPSITDAYFAASTKTGVLAEWFPLLEPDTNQTTRYKRKLTIPDWPGTRLPVLGLFYVPGASAVNRILPIVACHFAANDILAGQQIGALRYFSLLSRLAGAAASPAPLGITPPGSVVRSIFKTNDYVLLGDFNIDYLTNANAYDTLTGADPSLGGTGWINVNTHLMTYKKFKEARPKSTEELVVSDYDNFFTRVNPGTPAAVTPGNPLWHDIPEEVQKRSLVLSASVQYYQELDQRGFSSDPYKDIVNDFASQLNGDTSHIINLTGALVGGRLISDHLPVTLDITLN
jgi:hypothetical protein